MQSGLYALPIPILTFLLSAVAGAMVWRHDLGNVAARGFFAAFFALITLGSLLVGLRFGYGIDGLLPIQRAIPLFAGPLLYLGFAMLCLPRERRRKTAIMHLVPAALISLAPQVIPQIAIGYDLIIGLIYIVYTGALVLLWRKGADNLAYARLELADTLLKWMLVGASVLALMLLIDSTIAISFMQQDLDRVTQIISFGAILEAIALAVVILLVSRRLPDDGPALSPSPSGDEPSKLEEQTRALLYETELFLQTDLTVDRLAKRMHVPVRTLSSAINSGTGMNVSQYVNGFRLEHAAKLLADSSLSVAAVAEQSGFLARSNFYREFQRHYGLSPAAYRSQSRAD